MKLTAEIFLCNYLKCSREHLQNEISRNPTKVIKAMETYAEIFNKDLQHFKDNGGELLNLFWQRESDTCPLECGEAEKQELEFKDWYNEYYGKAVKE